MAGCARWAGLNILTVNLPASVSLTRMFGWKCLGDSTGQQRLLWAHSKARVTQVTATKICRRASMNAQHYSSRRPRWMALILDKNRSSVFFNMCGTSDILVLCQAGDAEQISTLGLAGRQRLTPGYDSVQVELVTCTQLLVWLPEVLTTGNYEKTDKWKLISTKVKWVTRRDEDNMSTQQQRPVMTCLPVLHGCVCVSALPCTGQKPHLSPLS